MFEQDKRDVEARKFMKMVQSIPEAMAVIDREQEKGNKEKLILEEFNLMKTNYKSLVEKNVALHEKQDKLEFLFKVSEANNQKRIRELQQDNKNLKKDNETLKKEISAISRAIDTIEHKGLTRKFQLAVKSRAHVLTGDEGSLEYDLFYPSVSRLINGYVKKEYNVNRQGLIPSKEFDNCLRMVRNFQLPSGYKDKVTVKLLNDTRLPERRKKALYEYLSNTQGNGEKARV